jgi:hypothetical protein
MWFMVADPRASAMMRYLRVSTMTFAFAPDSTRSWAFAISDRGKIST